MVPQKSRGLNIQLAQAIWPFGFTMKFKPRKDICVECGTKIPPGKAGRKCKECRDI